MISIQVNSNNLTCKSTNLATLLVELEYADSIVATALNGEFVAQNNRVNTPIQQGDKVEILAPMQGG
ncbi:sulfur carrier protein ThiS [Alteromonas sp. 5E99-2]|uniref:sulfur carrier protein ThiS n=1 Tax=Alteromonas sp. 5E99-2 TaxID=2817683 RepID=UPI001A97DA19|nr:sulfur carrier protein ThiS [Alteromonas sp. 5E99-2]MBO1256262.1 sulfur carrier protein ThiS [Alteromonas sp. 5E99-2]